MKADLKQTSAESVPDGELDCVADRVALDLIRRTGIRDPERWVEPMRRRWGWGFKKQTLAEVGDALGVTRERVRQVAKAVDALPPQGESPIPTSLVESIELVDWDEPGDISELLVDSMLAVPGSHWSANGLLDLLEAHGRRDLAGKLRFRMEEGKRRSFISDDLKKAVRKARYESGFLDVRTVRLDGDTVPADTVLAATREIYKRVAVVGPWILCGSKKPTTVENAAVIQLQVAGKLPGDALYVGIARVLRKRRFHSPPRETILVALEESGIIGSVGDGYVLTANAPEVALVGNDLWLFELLSAEPQGVLAVDDVVRRAKDDGLKVSSINVHLSFTSFVRKDRGLVFLVGSEIDPEWAEVLRRAAKARKVPSACSYSVQPEGIELVITIGTNYLNSGVVSIDKGLRALTSNQRPNVACCDEVAFDVRLGQDGGTWYGWSSLFNHLIAVHGVDEGDVVRFLMTDDLVKCIEPWATENDIDAPGLDLDGDSLVEAANEVSDGRDVAGVDSSRGISPGDPWPDPRGSRTLVLSIKSRALTIPGSTSGGTSVGSSTLAQKYGPGAAQLAEEMLEVRPSGGRVWVDRDGNATTLIDGRLTYLGRIPSDWEW